MKKITFKIENVKKVEEFLGAELYTYMKIGEPEATFRFPKEDGKHIQKELKLTDGAVIFKNIKSEILLKVN